jgi:hypothetical protein
MGEGSVLIVEHRFPLKLQDRLQYGRFNVGYLSFRNNSEGRCCLDDWSGNCIEWCYDRVEGDKFADQKYLDTWPEKYPGLVISQNIGLNVAPWNVSQNTIRIVNDVFFIDSYPLILYHFQALKLDILHKNCYCFDNRMRSYQGCGELIIPVISTVYCVYIFHLISIMQSLFKISRGKNFCGNIRNAYSCQKKSGFPVIVQILEELIKVIKERSKDDIIIVIVITNIYLPILLRDFKNLFFSCISIKKSVCRINLVDNSRKYPEITFTRAGDLVIPKE